MGRKDTQVLNNIHMLCRLQQIDEKILCYRSKLILSIYRDVCWSTAGRANETSNRVMSVCSSDLDDALIYLETFAPDEQKERFEKNILTLFETRWMIELVDNAMLQVRNYPYRGDMYCEILTKCYLSCFKYKEAEMLEIFHLERSTYYDRKKEAILLFGLSLWGNAIPKLKRYLRLKYQIKNFLNI